MKSRLFFQAFYEGNIFEFINSVNMGQDLLNNWAADLIISGGEIILLSVFAKGIIQERYESVYLLCLSHCQGCSFSVSIKKVLQLLGKDN